MNRRKTRQRRSTTSEWLLRVGLIVLIVIVAGPDPASGIEADFSGGLFSPVANSTVQEESRVDLQERPFFLQEPQPVSNTDETLRSRPVRVDLLQLAAAREDVAQGAPAGFRLNLFDDVEVEAVIERTADTRYGYSLSGQIEGQAHGSVTLVISGDMVAGAVHTQEGMYVIASANGAIHSVREVTGDFKCGVDGHAHADLFARETPGALTTIGSDGDDGSEIDLLVVFTEAALAVEGGLRQMRASIDLAVTYTNDAYQASGVNFRLNLVAAVQVDYREPTKHGNAGLANQNLTMSHLLGPTDGSLDEVHALRDAYAADIVHLVVDQAGGGGVASLLRPTEENPDARAFSISNSLSSYPAFLAHEAGHVMGLLHDHYTEQNFRSGRNDKYPLPWYSHGYVNQRAFETGATEESRWYTIMAYNLQCRDEGIWCREIPRFSNPTLTYPNEDGDPLGVPGDQPTGAVDGPADAVRSLNETRSLIAGFRESATRCEYGLSEERREVPASGGVLSFGFDADSSCDATVTSFGDFLSIQSDTSGSTGSASIRVEPNDGAARVGYVVVAGETMSVYQSGVVAPAKVCDRTPAIRDAIVSVVGRECDAVSEFDLLDVVFLDLSRQRIETVDTGDFTGLGNLVELRLHDNRLATIPDEAFRDLINLKILNLAGTAFTSVPTAIRQLSSLQEIYLQSGQIEHLARNSFEGLSELRWLVMSDNRLSTLPDGVVSDLKNLQYLYLGRNRISTVRKEALQGPVDLARLTLNHNPLEQLPDDVFEGISNVSSLLLRDTQLSAISPASIAGLTHISELDLAENRIANLTGVVFPASNLQRLNLSNNAIEALPPGIFAGFTSSACANLQLILDLSENPGASFPLSAELIRIDGGSDGAGPATVVVRVREGAPWPMTFRVTAEGGSSFTKEVTVVNGEVESEPFEVAGDDVTSLRFSAGPDVPGSYKGVRIALGDDLQLFGLADREPGSATDLALGVAVQGQIEPGDDEDQFRLKLGNPASVAVYTTGDLDTLGTLSDESGETVASDDDDGRSFNFHIEADLPAGVYYVRVASYGLGTGPYTLHARRFADVALGETGETVRLWGTADGGWTLDTRTDVPFSSGQEVTASNGDTYLLTLGSDAMWTASPKPGLCVTVPDGTIDTLAGTGVAGFGGDGGFAIDAQLNSPFDVAVDAAGYVYVADWVNHRIRRIGPDGTIETFAGTGVAGYGGDGGPAHRPGGAQLNGPIGVAVDAAGYVYIADHATHRIRRIATDGTIETFAGLGVAGYSGDGGPATAAQLDHPTSVAVDTAGNVYVADSENHSIRRIGLGGTIETIAGTGVAGDSGDGGPATEARLSFPFGVAVDANGNVYVADTVNHRVRRIGTDGTIKTVAGTGAAGYAGDDGAATAAQLDQPAGLAVDAAGNVYVADWGNHRVRWLGTGGTIGTFAGTGERGFGGDGGPAAQARLFNPSSVAVDPGGQVYIADAGNNRLRTSSVADECP